MKNYHSFKETDRRELDRRYNVVWENEQENGYRYIAKAFNGGPNWMIWDRKSGSFVSNENVLKLQFEDVTEKLLS